MQLEEKRRQIELEKRRSEIANSQQQQQVGKAAFLHAINKVLYDFVFHLGTFRSSVCSFDSRFLVNTVLFLLKSFAGHQFLLYYTYSYPSFKFSCLCCSFCISIQNSETIESRVKRFYVFWLLFFQCMVLQCFDQLDIFSYCTLSRVVFIFAFQETASLIQP